MCFTTKKRHKQNSEMHAGAIYRDVYWVKFTVLYRGKIARFEVGLLTDNIRIDRGD